MNVDPVEKQTDSGVEISHPAFGQITLHNVSGSRNLYGSDFFPGGYVQIEIRSSTIRRARHEDRYYPGGVLATVHLSHAQWATFLSSANQGEGACCTVDYIGARGQIPHITNPRNEKEEVRKDIESYLQEALDALDGAAIATNDSKISKTKQQEIINLIHKARRSLDDSVPYVVDRFSEHVEEKVEQAKVDAHGYINSLIRDMGLQAIQQQQHQIEDMSDESI